MIVSYSMIGKAIIMQPDAFSPDAPGHVVHQPAGYWAFIPKPLPPDLVWKSSITQSLSAADRAVGELAGLGHALPDPHLLIKPFIRREAVLSSRIEGTRTSLGQLYSYEATQLTLFEFPDDVLEVNNYVQALQYGLSRLATLPVSLRLVRELHARLMEGVRGQEWTPGEFRRSQNWIGPPGSTLTSAVFVPPPVNEMQVALAQWEKYIHSPDDLPPLVRLALIHYQFEVIHPFLDGNGRVGRLLIPLLLHIWQLLPQPLLYLSAYFEAHRQAYYDHLLAVSQHGDWQGWLNYFLEGTRSQAIDATLRVRRLQELRSRYRTQFQSARTAARLLQVVDWLFERPVFTISQVGDMLGVNYPTAQRYVQQLETASVIREITGKARNRVYQADAILEAIDR
jgi:Fic family protein